MRKYFLDWLRKEINQKEDFEEDEFNEGYLAALNDIESKVQYGIFDEVVYVKLKQEYSIKDLNHNKEYEALCVLGGEYFEIVDNKGVLHYHERFKFEVSKIYSPYRNKYFTKNDIKKYKKDQEELI